MHDERDIWALVGTITGMVIGRIKGVGDLRQKQSLVGATLLLNPAYELTANVMIAQAGQVAKNVVATPYANTMRGAPLYAVALSIQFFSDMEEADVQRYKKIVEGVEAHVEKIRAQDAGIALATKMPTEQ
jgi:hypothetical protein